MTSREPDGRSRARALTLAAGAALAAFGLARGGPAPDDGPAPRRAPWTTSRVSGSPETPRPYAVEPAFPKLTFEQPIALAEAPGTGRIFVAELRGRVVSFPNDPNAAKADLDLDLARLRPGPLQLYGMAFHPKFRDNRYVYLCYLKAWNEPDGARVSRFTLDRADPPAVDPSTEKVLISWRGGGHDAGCLAFGPDGCLYIATGDAGDPTPPDPFDTGQDLGDLLASLLRIDVDGEDPGKAYRVPPDNPFVTRPGARPEVWAFGFRNPWRFSFDRKTGDLWAGDVGWELWELIHRVERGGNHGWSLVEGSQPVHPGGKRGPGPVVPPVVEHPHSEAASITGGYVYRGRRLPSLVGVYVYGDYQTGKVWGLKHDGKAVTWKGELADTPLQLVSFGEDSAGELYALDFDRTRQVYRFAPNPAAEAANRDFPRTLSATGLFASTADHAPAAGVHRYALNAEPWADGATAERLLAVPGEGRVEADKTGYWRFPEGSVLAKTVSMGRRRVETQILHREGGVWRPYTYAWNDAQTDATLAAAEGSTRTISARDDNAPGGVRERPYRVNARSECLLCHNPWVETRTTTFGRQTASPLGVTTSQLDRDGPGGNQVDVFRQLGLLTVSPPDDPHRRRMCDPYDERADRDNRARSYLQVNCAHCHQFGAGGSAAVWLAHDLPMDRTNTVDVRPMQGTFGLAGARVIAPGAPESSVLFYRLAKLGSGRMPRVGSDQVDDAGLRLIGDWIASMPKAKGAPPALTADETRALAEWKAPATPAETRERAARRLAGTTSGALALVRSVEAGSVPARVAAGVAGGASAEVRDLFERFAPGGRNRGDRLGDSVDPRKILALKGDPAKGRAVFLAETGGRCAACHKVNGEGPGGEVGPDLAGVGDKYPGPALLQHVLEPSKAVDPKYTAYLLETKAGLIHSGLLAEKTANEVVLKDARGQLVRVPAAEVEQLTPQSKSLMPDLLLRDLTAQQAADLLAFLASLRKPAARGD